MRLSHRLFFWHRAIRRKLLSNAGKNNQVVYLTLSVLETCAKNCRYGGSFWGYVLLHLYTYNPSTIVCSVSVADLDLDLQKAMYTVGYSDFHY